MPRPHQSRKCCDCKTPTPRADLRPYGKRGTLLCYPCAIKPENAVQAFKTLVKKLEAAGPVALVGGPNGPVRLPYVKWGQDKAEMAHV